MQGKLGVMKLHAVWGSQGAPTAGAGGMSCGARLNSYPPQGAVAGVESV